MEYLKLGSSGLSVSRLCLGTMQFGWTADQATSLKVLDAAFDAGVNFIDTANIYSRWVDGNPGGISEQILGEWFRRNPSRREQIVLATKVRGPMGDGPNDQGLSRKHILKAVEDSMERMQTSYIDLYQLHWPDEDTPIEETLETLTELVARGWVHYIGCSNFSSWRLVEALLLSEVNNYSRFVCLQPHYNLIHREEYEHELQSICIKYGIGVIPYSPLARGFLTGKYTQAGSPPDDHEAIPDRIKGYLSDPQNIAVMEQVRKMSQSYGVSATQLSLAWLLNNPSVTSPIIGPRSIDQLMENLASLQVNLASDDKQKLDVISAWQS
jgi:aryl-alcohol dehydrogenase-like predicted oxidoreductase